MSGLGYRHQRVQRLRRLLTRRSTREAEGSFVLEGTKLITEALDAGAVVESVYLDRSVYQRAGRGGAAGGDASLSDERAAPGDPSEGGEPVGWESLVDRCHAAGLRVFELEAGVLGRVADTVNPQPVLAVAAALDVPLAELATEAVAEQGGPLVVVGVDLRDPGNAGSLLRSAAAAGADAVVLCAGSVDLYNPKVVRASAGAIFHVPVVVGGPAAEVLAELGRRRLSRLATVARGGGDYTAVDLSGPTAIVLGNEANGLPAELDGYLDGAVSIPMAARTESLNVATAAAVVCFEAARQRRSRAGRSPG